MGLAREALAQDGERRTIIRWQLHLAHPERRRALSEADEMSAVAQATTEAWHEQQCSGTNPPLFERFAQGHRHRGRRHVAVALDIDVDALHRHVGPSRYGLDDAQVRLVRHQQIDIGGAEPGPGERLLARARHALHRALENLLPFELPARHAVEHTAVGIAPPHALYA